MATKKQVKYENPRLAIAWYYDGEDMGNFATFVIDNKCADLNAEFLKFANKWNDWGVKDKDIIDIFIISDEEDFKGRNYKINVSA